MLEFRPIFLLSQTKFHPNLILQQPSKTRLAFSNADQMQTCQPRRTANFCQPQSSSEISGGEIPLFLDKRFHVLWVKVVRTCSFEKLFFLTYFDVWTKAKLAKFASGNRL